LRLTLFLLAACAFMALEFYAWSAADSPFTRGKGNQILWAIVSFPLFYLPFHSHLLFWPLFVANSCLWAAIVIYLWAKFQKKSLKEQS
jgi:hypothetical protein